MSALRPSGDEQTAARTDKCQEERGAHVSGMTLHCFSFFAPMLRVQLSSSTVNLKKQKTRGEGGCPDTNIIQQCRQTQNKTTPRGARVLFETRRQVSPRSSKCSWPVQHMRTSVSDKATAPKAEPLLRRTPLPAAAVGIVSLLATTRCKAE